MTQELTNWQQFQLNRFGNILEVPDMEIEEPGEAEARRFQEWSQLQNELQLNDFDKD